MNSEIKDVLYKPFDDIKSRRGRGGTYDYVTWKNVADRMNEVFGMNWSSEVQHQEMIGDNIIMRVSVCALNPDNDKDFCQEGYGGAILRASDEPGTAHKSAYSKALKDACKKWGIGLHLEEGTESSSSAPKSIPSGYSGHATGNPTFKAPPQPITTDAPTPLQPVQSIEVKQPSITQNIPSMPNSNSVQAPPIPSVSVQQTQNTNMGAPMVPTSHSLPVTPGPINKMVTEAPNTVTTEDDPGTITNVQEMAIKNLARLNSDEELDPEKFLKTLILSPDCELTREVTGLKELSYNEAVSVIKATKK